MTRRARLVAVLSAFLLAAGAARAADAPTAPDYARDVAPLFARHCVECHGERKQENLLRLDGRREALAGGMSGDAIVPGRSRDSLLVKHLRGEVRPPMPYKRPPLEPSEIATIAAWIDAGAPGAVDAPVPSHEPRPGPCTGRT